MSSLDSTGRQRSRESTGQPGTPESAGRQRSRESTGRRISLAHLTLIDVPPAALVRVAAEAGYDAVGLRIVPVTNGPDYSLSAGSKPLREVVQILQDTGLEVLDAEVVRLGPTTDPAAYEGFLDAAAELGARHVVVVVEDPVPGRAAATLAGLCALAAGRQITAMVEFMMFKEVRTLLEAVALLAEAGADNAGVLLDPLHLARSGGTVEQVRQLPAELVPYLQICDAASAQPAQDAEAAGVEARRARLLPGTGQLPLTELLAAVPLTAALSLEVPDGWVNPDPLGRARQVLDSAISWLARSAPVS
jgi:sugar phosphate isomerase/epimerase